MTDAPTKDRPSARRPSDIVAIVLVTLLALGVLAAPVYVVLKDRATGSSMTTMGNMGGTAVSLETLDASLAEVYLDARSHGSHFEEIPCFCGCQEGRLEHRNLLDCFVLRDGSGWESHATGCGICQGEARMALRLLEAGTPIDETKTQIIDEFGMPEEMRDLQEG
jgi:hypothetical protein